MDSLYTTENAKKEILNLYNKKLKDLKFDFNQKTIETSFGKTHIIECGDASKPPILLVHGSNGCAPITLETYPNIYNHYHVFSIDVLAQPNKSAENRLNMKDNSYGVWINEIIDLLSLQNVTLAGFSFGGLIILKTLLQNESKIKEVFLSAPAFIVNGNPLVLIFKVFIPMKMYMKTKKTTYLQKFLKALFTERDDFAFNYLAKVFLHFHMDFSPVPIIKNKEAENIKTPITLFAAKNDIMFPGNRMIKRAKRIFPSLINTILLEDSKHVQNKKDNALIVNLITKKTSNE